MSLMLIAPIGGGAVFMANVTAIGPDPGYGRPDLPGFGPGHPSGGPVFPGGPVDPGYGRPGWSPVDPGFGHPGGSVDPGYGIGSGLRPSHELPGGGHISGQPIPPPTEEKPPGTIYPPLPPDMPVAKWILIWMVGVGYRWISVPPTKPAPPTGQPAPKPA